MLKSLVKLPSTFKACTHSLKDIIMLTQWAESKLALGSELEDRMKRNLIFKSIQISKLVFSALKSIDRGDWLNAGEMIGEATLLVTMV